MKPLCINLLQAIRNGILRIFPRPFRQLIVFAAACTLMGCAATKQATQVVERISTDTLYLSNIRYDSIYISQEKYVDRTRDTLLIQDKVVEYRYRLLRDTLYRVQIDTIPIVREVEVVREVRYIPLWAKLLSAAGAAALLLLLLRVIRLQKTKN